MIFNSSFDDENQLSPRANLIYQPTDATTLHAGYARYFTPPPIENVSGGTVNKFDVRPTNPPPVRMRRIVRSRPSARITSMPASTRNYCPVCNAAWTLLQTSSQPARRRIVWPERLSFLHSIIARGVLRREFTPRTSPMDCLRTPTWQFPRRRAKTGTRRSSCSIRRCGVRKESLDLSGSRPDGERLFRRLLPLEGAKWWHACLCGCDLWQRSSNGCHVWRSNNTERRDRPCLTTPSTRASSRVSTSEEANPEGSFKTS